MDVWLGVFFTVLGLLAGSFLNVVVLRFGFRERASERSRCAACDSPLGPWDLVPVLSYLALRGRCRTCGSAVHAQYPLVEIGTGVLFGATYLFLLPATLFEAITFLAVLGFWASLVALVAYDIRHTLVPMSFVYMLAAFAAVHTAVAAYALQSVEPAIDALLGAAVCGGFFAGIHFLTRGRGMGIGDAYVAAGIGLLLGLSNGIAASAYGVWIGAAVGLLMLCVTRVFPQGRLLLLGRRVTLSSEIPFAPFLAIGAVIAFFAPLAPFLGFWISP